LLLCRRRGINPRDIPDFILFKLLFQVESLNSTRRARHLENGSYRHYHLVRRLDISMSASSPSSVSLVPFYLPPGQLLSCSAFSQPTVCNEYHQNFPTYCCESATRSLLCSLRQGRYSHLLMLRPGKDFFSLPARERSFDAGGALALPSSFCHCNL
jgi:hypothetical protein